MASPIVSPISSSPAPVSPHSVNMEHGQRYWHFLNDGTKIEGPKLYGRLVSNAQDKIVIWDPYVFKEDISLLQNITSATELIIMTSCSAGKWTERKDIIYNELKIQVPSAVKSNLMVSLGYINTDVHGREKWQSHDRYLFIDDSEYFLIGSSMAHHRSLQSSTGILHLEHQSDCILVQDAFNKVYNKAISKGWITTYSNLL